MWLTTLDLDVGAHSNTALLTIFGTTSISHGQPVQVTAYDMVLARDDPRDMEVSQPDLAFHVLPELL